MTPVQLSLPGGKAATDVSVGFGAALAVASDGSVLAWGPNVYGSIGDGTTTIVRSPEAWSLPGGVAVTKVVQSGENSFAIGSDGHAYSWGLNDYNTGLLGNGSTAEYSPTPMQLSLPAGAVATAVSGGLAIADGTTAATTETTLSASPGPAEVGNAVTLTALVSASDGTIPAGMVLFYSGPDFDAGGTQVNHGAETMIGAPVTVSANGVATTTTTFPVSATFELTAEFIPAGNSYASSIQTLSVIVAGVGGSVPITVTVPPTGALTVTVAPGAVNLTEQATTPVTATGTLDDITVSDTRNTYQGWVVYGQVSPFTGSGPATGATIPGDQLGWTPTAVSPLVGGATLGPPVAPGTSPNGLGDTAQELAHAPNGQGLGENTLSASLTLDEPAITRAGPYSASLSITYLDIGPIAIGVTF
jgi:hypothetical protein